MKGILLYIDPGTGAMLFSLIMGVVTTLFFVMEKLWVKIKFLFTGGRADAKQKERMGIVIFSDSKRYWNVFEPICDELEKRKVSCHYWTASPDDPALKKDYEFVEAEFIGEGNKAYARLNMMSADVCLATTPGLDVYQWKRSKNVSYYVHITHSVGGITGYKMFGIDYYDAVLLTGRFQEKDIRKLEELRNLPAKELYVVGSAYMDELMKRLENKSVGAGSSSGQNTDGEPGMEGKNALKTILVAPSWGESSILSKYGEGFLEQLKGLGQKVIIRPHPQSKTSEAKMLERLQEKYPNDNGWEWNFDNDNFDVLSKADILISDYSSVVFDFAFIFEKPVLCADAKFDPGPYDAYWLDEVHWNLRVLPSIGRQLKEEDFANIGEIIDETLREDKYVASREKLRDTVWQHRGEAAKRVADFIIGKQREANLSDGDTGIAV